MTDDVTALVAFQKWVHENPLTARDVGAEVAARTLTTASDACTDHARTLAEREALITRQAEAIAKLVTDVDDIKAALAERDAEIARLTEQIAVLPTNPVNFILQLEAALAASQRRHEALTAKVQRWRDARHKLDAEDHGKDGVPMEYYEAAQQAADDVLAWTPDHEDQSC